MSDNNIVIPRDEILGRVSERWAGLETEHVNAERWACDVPDDMSLAEWHYEQALNSLAIAVEMKRLGH
jgi:hypothetical protein